MMFPKYSYIWNRFLLTPTHRGINNTLHLLPGSTVLLVMLSPLIFSPDLLLSFCVSSSITLPFLFSLLLCHIILYWQKLP